MRHSRWLEVMSFSSGCMQMVSLIIITTTKSGWFPDSVVAFDKPGSYVSRTQY